MYTFVCICLFIVCLCCVFVRCACVFVCIGVCMLRRVGNGNLDGWLGDLQPEDWSAPEIVQDRGPRFDQIRPLYIHIAPSTEVVYLVDRLLVWFV